MALLNYTLDEEEKNYSERDLKDLKLKYGQIYRWQITDLDAKKSRAGNDMIVLTIAPVTASDKVLRHFEQTCWVTLPVRSLGEKAFRPALQKYFAVMSAFCSPLFDAYKSIEKTDSGTVYYDHAGNALDAAQRETAQTRVRAAMMDAREHPGDFLQIGQQAYALLKEPREGSRFPELSSFIRDVSPNSKAPFVDDEDEMIG
jgi:hypothetical protein